ncbi:uncharacterized protein LOC105844463 isoform X3 [Hydra vulgaris]|uniref:Uncharacterized protein LOC105844463 isoform X3 n=2 Tax=Hydra vulgaris TaxID=6087 RepID=A0ABM4BYK4_HYDVU
MMIRELTLQIAVFCIRINIVLSSPPLINNKIGDVFINFCQIGEVQLYLDQYSDGITTNGRDYTLTLLDNQYLPVKPNSKYVQYNSSLRKLFFVPQSFLPNSTKQDVFYTMRIKNSNGDINNDSFKVSMSGIVPEQRYIVTAKVRISNPDLYTTDVEKLYRLLTKIHSYFTNQFYVSKSLYLVDYSIVGDVMIVSLQDCLFNQGQQNCNRKNKYDLKSQFCTRGYKINDVCVPRQILYQQLSPEFQLLDITLSSYNNNKGTCNRITQPKTLSKLGGELVEYEVIGIPGLFIFTFPIPFYEKSETTSPDDVFDLFVLSLNKSTEIYEFVPLTYWAYVYNQKDVHQLYITLTDEAWNFKDVAVFVFDYELLSLEAYSVYLPPMSNRPLHYYYVEFSFSSFNTQNINIWSYHMQYFLNSLIDVLGRSTYGSKIYLRWFYLNGGEFATQKKDTSGYLAWGIDFREQCDFALIRTIQKTMFSNSSLLIINPKFLQNMSNVLTLISIKETYNGICKFNAPVLKNVIPTIQFSFCGINTFQIPQNAFMDVEDGDTRNLKLTLLNENNQQLSSDSWIQFNISTQTIIGLASKSIISKSYRFILVVTDSSELSISSYINIFLNESVAEETFFITMKGLFIPLNLNVAYTAWSYINRWLYNRGYFLNDFRLLQNTLTSLNENYFSFTSCSFRAQPCDAIKIKKYTDLFFESDTSVKQDFLAYMSPIFSNLKISSDTAGACKTNNPPVLNKPWGPLFVSTCETFLMAVPIETFNDLEQGNTRFLYLTLTSLNQNIVPEWIQFSSENQTLTIVPYQLLKNTYFSYQLKATDLGGQSVVQTLNIIINMSLKEPSLLVNMNFSVRFQVSDFVTIYKTIRNLVVLYFGDIKSSVEYIILSSYPNSVYSIQWTNCTVSRNICEMDKYRYVEERIKSPSFLSYLNLNFVILNISIAMNGICFYSNTPPKVMFPIPAQSLKYCWYLKYLIPENTFSDFIDGGTRNLTLSMTQSDGSLLSSNSIASFNSETQEVAILVTSFPIKNQSNIFSIIAKTKRGLSVTTPFVILVIGQPVELKSFVQFIVVSNLFKKSEPNTYAYIMFMNLFNTIYQFNPESAHAYEIINGNSFVSIKMVPCGLQSCTGAIDQQRLSQQRYNLTAFQPYFTIEQIEYKRDSSCQGQPPVVVQSLKQFVVKTCETFSYNISKQAFQDSDGSENLIYIITQINREYIIPSRAWATIEGMTISGLIPYNILLNQPNGLFNLTIRAVNSYQLFAETSVLMIVDGPLPQIFYKYAMTANTIGSLVQSNLHNQILVTNTINKFFNNRTVNILSYSNLVSGGFKLEWSVCLLPNFCTQSGLKEYSAKIYNFGQASSGVSSLLLNLFSSVNLKLLSIDEVVLKQYMPPFNYPTSLVSIYNITVDYCGGFKHLIDENLFLDVEDGNTRKLKLRLMASEKDYASTQFSWIILNQNQEIQGMPTYTEAKSKYVLLLYAQDSCGLETSISIVLQFKQPINFQQPTYFYRFIFSSVINPDVTSRFLFMDTLANFLGDSNRSNIGFSQFNQNMIFYFNCSISYSPCDIYKLDAIYNKLATPDSLPRSSLINAFTPNFILTLVVKQLDKCYGPFTPIVVDPPPKIFVWLCGVFTYYIPEKTFYDYEQGYTKNLNLNLQSSSYASSLIQFSSSSQSISILPTASFMALSTSYYFNLVATNRAQLSSLVSLVIQLQGPYSLFRECQIKLLLVKGMSRHSSTYEAAIFIIGKLAVYFSIRIDEIVVVDLQDSTDSITFSWSFCSKNYQSYVNDSTAQSVDYIAFQQKILMRLFYEDRVTFNVEFKNVFGSYFTVSTVTTDFTKRCANFPPISLKDEITIIISYGGYYFHTYQDNYFYDFKDGGAFNLKISLSTLKGSPVQLDSWVNVDIVTRRIIAVVYDSIRRDVLQKYQFYLTAINSLGLTSQISVVILKDSMIYNQLGPFYIRYYFSYAGSSDSVYVNQSAYMVDSILRYFTSITSKSMILVNYFLKAYGYLEYRVMEWTVAFHTCDSIVLKTIKDMYTNQGALNNLFVSSTNGNSYYKFAQINFASTCFSPPPPPRPFNPISPPGVNFCSVYVFRLPADLFIDSEGSQHLALRLLDSNYKKVSTSSWIQINSATQELFAISILSLFKFQSSYQYFIQATNSANLTALSGFNFTMNNYPFTSDCKISVTFNYKFVVEELAELDVLRLFIEKTSSYYGDSKVNNIKIIQFQKVSSSYQVVWSNCSFSFSSQLEATRGLTEAYRSQISFIFSKVVLVTGKINPNYFSFMSEYFEILEVSGNYDCIEEPPIPNGNYIEHAEFCSLFYKRIDSMTFYDKRDGNTRFLQLGLTFQNGNKVSPDHWIQMNDDQYVYGVLTPQVIQRATEYQYLIVATDSSGRTANVSYKILTSTKDIPFDPFFRTGFDVLKDDMSTAFLLFTFVRNLSLYLNSSDKLGQIYIKSFDYPSTIVWTHCSLIICTQQNLDNIITKLTTIQNKPVSQFITAMQPYIIPYSTQFCLGSCGRNGGSDTVVITPPPISVNECGFWKFYVPSNAFRDILGYLDSKSFCLNLLYTNGSSVQKSSWLQFNGPQQMFYGVATITQMSSNQNYLLTSVNQITSFFKSSQWSFDYTKFESLQKYGTELCFFEFLLSSEYNSDYNDVNIVFLFITTLSAYLKSDSNTIQIYSFQRYSGYPYNFRIIWTNCSYTASFIQTPFSNFYYASISSILTQITTFKDNSYNVNEMIYKYFKENSKFTILSVSINKKCFKPPNTPPKSNGDLSLYPKCGLFRYLIPGDAFYDEQDGNTRNLTLYLRKANGLMLDASDWLFINNSQYILGLLFNETILSQTKYEFLLEAVDSQGLKASLKLLVFMPKDPLPFPAFAASLRYTITISANILVYFQVLEKLEYWAAKWHNIKKPQLFLYGLESNVIRFSHCEVCGNQDFNRLLQNFVDSEQDFGRGDEIIIAELNGVFDPLLELESIGSEVIYDYCSKVAPFSMFIIPLKMCYLWSFDLVLNETTTIYNYNVILTGPNRVPLPSTEFMWLNKYVLEAYPKESFWKSVKNYTYQYILLDKKTGNTMSYDRPLTFESVVGSLDSNYLQYIATVQTPTVMDQVDNFYISLVLTSVRNQVGPKNGSNIHFLRYEKLAFNRYKVYWINCSMTNDCTSSDYFNVHKLVSSLTLPPGYVINVLMNNCINKPIIGSAIHLYIPVCGLFKYKLNSSFTKPGTIIKLTQVDGSDLPLDSWIRLNATSGEIYALPTEYIVQLKQVKNYLLQFLTDFVTLINVTVEVKNDRDSFYSVTAAFQSFMSPQTPLLDIEIKFLELIVSYSKRNMFDFRVISISSDSYLYYLKYADCTVPKRLCEKDQKIILQNEAKIMTVDREPNKNFSAYIANYFSINIINNDLSLLMIEVPPVFKKVIPTVVLYACQPQCIDLSTLFFEACNEFLLYTFYFGNNTIVPNSYWAQLANQYICFYPTPNVIPGIYRFKLKVYNSCNSSAQIDVTANIISIYQQNFGYEWSMDVNILQSLDTSHNVSMLYDTDISIIKLVYEPLVQYLSNSTGALQQIQLLYYKIDANILTLKFADCKMCTEQTVTSLKNALFLEPRVLSENLKKVIKVINVSSSTCNLKSPKCNTTMINIQAPICQLFKFKFENSLCFDNNKNGLQSLFTTFYSANLETEQLPVTSWIQYDNQSKVIYGYPKYIGYTYTNRYFLKVADNDNNQAIIEIDITIYGTPNLDYQLTINGYIFDLFKSYLQQEMCLIEKISSYFNSSINSMYFQINQNKLFDYTWSFCKKITNSCDCSEIARTQELIEKDFSEALRPCVLVNNKAYTLYGQCKATPGPKVNNKISEILIIPGNLYNVNLPIRQFIGTEDSGNLSLYLVKNGNFDWLQLYGNSICGLLVYEDYIQLGYKKESTQFYSVAAKDSCGKIAYDQFRVKFIENFSIISYRIYILLENSYYNFVRNCIYLGGLIQLLADTGGVSKDDIVLYNLQESNNTVNGTTIEFFSKTYTNCESSQFVTYVEKFYKDGKGNEVFIRSLEKSGYKVNVVNLLFSFPCSQPDPPRPWFWLIVIIVVVFLLLLLWLLWLFIPRCCPSCCSRFCSCCDPCCKKGGKFASLSAEGNTCWGACCGGNLQSRKSSFNSVTKIPGFSSVSPSISRKSSDTSEYHIKVESPDKTDWANQKPKLNPIVDKFTQTSEHSMPSNNTLNLIKPPLPPLSPSSPSSFVQTRSWHDDRKNIYKHKKIYIDDIDGQNDRNNKYKQKSIYLDDDQDDRSKYKYINMYHNIGDRNNNVSSYQRHLKNENFNEDYSNRDQSYFDSARKNSFYLDRNRDYHDYNDEPPGYMLSVPSKHEIVHYKETRRPDYHDPEVHQLGRYNSGRLRRRSSFKHPITVKVRRSELKKYLGSNDTNKIKLQPGDIRRLLRGNARVKLLGERDYDDSPDKTYRKLSVKKKLSHGNRNRSYSTTSLSDELNSRKFVQNLPNSSSSSYEFFDRRRSYSDSSADDYKLERRRGASISPRKIFLTLGEQISPRINERNSRLTLRKDSFTRKRSQQPNNYVYKDQSFRNKRRDSTEMASLSNKFQVNKTYLEDSYI